MRRIFGGKEFNAEIYGGKDGSDEYVIRIFRGSEECSEQFSNLANLVIVPSCMGFLYLRFIGEDAVMSGILDKRYFSEDNTDEIIEFLEEKFPKLKNAYFPYHIDFAELNGYDEYNGEY